VSLLDAIGERWFKAWNKVRIQVSIGIRIGRERGIGIGRGQDGWHLSFGWWRGIDRMSHLRCSTGESVE
jgi:hypothetical protein